MLGKINEENGFVRNIKFFPSTENTPRTRVDNISVLGPDREVKSVKEWDTWYRVKHISLFLKSGGSVKGMIKCRDNRIFSIGNKMFHRKSLPQEMKVNSLENKKNVKFHSQKVMFGKYILAMGTPHDFHWKMGVVVCRYVKVHKPISPSHKPIGSGKHMQKAFCKSFTSSTGNKIRLIENMTKNYEEKVFYE